MPLHQPLRRTESDTTHVSDSEPEREVCRLTDPRSLSDDSSSAPDTPPTTRPPLSALQNTSLGTETGAWRALSNRLSAIEGDLTEIKRELYAQRPRKRDRTSFRENLPASTPPRKRARVMHSRRVGADSPVGHLAEPRIHRSSLMASTPEREEMGHCLQEASRPVRLIIPPSKKSVGNHAA
ncbi:hypothetical protein C8J57DRAFT_1336755 [Mycena rebaudengoi]|nr:hypothetical protein C8J57DRAFT_1336755 [Mycena rebaudengoi]